MSCQCTGCCCNVFVTKQLGVTGGGIATPHNPMCLSNFFPAGCIILLANSSDDEVSSPSSPLNGWRPFSITHVRERLSSSEDDKFCLELDFLIANEFIAATFCYSPGQITLRIYLIPYDLSNVQGRLQTRRADILSSARRFMKDLLPRIVQGTQLWESGITDDKYTSRLFEAAPDNRTLAEIYSDILSPSPSPWLDCPSFVHRFLDFSDKLENLGMRTSLFKYQRRTVVAMLRRELDASDLRDPLYIELKGMGGEPAYYQPSKTEILKSPPMIAPCRGGILCEELGTGKTVMVLALILATLGQLSSPEACIIDNERPVLTPTAFRHFPSATYAIARARRLRKQKAQFDGGNVVPSLVELMLHHNRLHPSPIQMERWESALESNLLPKLKANVPFYHDYGGDVANLKRVGRAPVNMVPKTLYLTTATLLILPLSLMAQWSSEILKHVEIPTRVLLVKAGDKIPLTQVLATDYDIVMMSYDRFSVEIAKGSHATSDTWDICTCAEFGNIRVPNCTCAQPLVSPLSQIRWKRLVIDEGHVSGTMNNNLSRFIPLLSVERKWIVTGTPSKNLLGLKFGQNGDPDLQEEGTTGDTNGDNTSVSGDESSNSTRVWSKYDAEDLKRLSVMLQNFIGVPVFKSNPRLFPSRVSEALQLDQ